MISKNGIPHIVVGAVLFIVGGYLAWSFYDYDMGTTEAAFLKSVILFSVISVLGLIILIFGMKKMRLKK
jgi:hypothetical protein